MNNADVTVGGGPVVRHDQLFLCPLGRARLLILSSWIVSGSMFTVMRHKCCFLGRSCTHGHIFRTYFWL